MRDKASATGRCSTGATIPMQYQCLPGVRIAAPIPINGLDATTRRLRPSRPPACVALRRPASPCVGRRCTSQGATLHPATLHQSAQVSDGRRWPSQGQSALTCAKSGQVRAIEKPRKSVTYAESGPQSGAGRVARTPHGGRSAGGRMILTPQQGVARQISRTRKIPSAVKISP